MARRTNNEVLAEVGETLGGSPTSERTLNNEWLEIISEAIGGVSQTLSRCVSEDDVTLATDQQVASLFE